MDPNIDPSIESQSIFDPSDLTQNNVFRLNDFDNIQQSNINIIQFNHFDNTINNNLNSNLLNNELINQTINATHQNSLLHHQTPLVTHPHNTFNSNHNRNHQTNNLSTRNNSTTDSTPVSFVQFNPQTKLKRLGRPRKNKSINIPTPENSSSQNFNESIISKFRFDEKPIIGPGSRGGKNKKQRGRIFKTDLEVESSPLSPTIPRKSKQQSISLPIKSAGDTLKTTTDASIDNNIDETLSSLERGRTQDTTKEPMIILEDYETLKLKGRSTAKEIALSDSNSINFKNGKLSKVSKNKLDNIKKINENITRINLSKKNKRKKEIPGPLLSLPNTLSIQDTSNKFETNSLVLGYSLKPVPWANDISVIILFLLKFREVFEEFPNLGPQDFETGLGLDAKHYDLKKYDYDEINLAESTSDNQANEGSQDEVSDIMEKLFWKLLTLALNRRTLISSSTQSKAIQEIKSLSLYHGYPPEWKNSLPVYNEPKIETEIDAEIEAKELEKGPVDPKNPEILDSKQYIYELPIALENNPFSNEEFERQGLRGIKPNDRLTLLKILTQWSLSNSDTIRALINKSIQTQDPTQEKNTYYVARSIKDGKEGIELAMNESREIFKKRQQRRLEYQNSKNGSDSPNVSVNGASEETDDGKFIEPASNPLEHPMNLRLVNFFAGDCGLWGRFFLVRMDNEYSGGLTSFDEMVRVWESDEIDYENKELPSSFKLYVQDYNKMLSGVYEIEGKKVETEGIVLEDKDITVFDPWFEVASNVEELLSFVEFLSSRLGGTLAIGNISTDDPNVASLYNLYNYLSSITKLLTKQESLIARYQRSVSKKIEYNDLINFNKKETDEEDYVEEDIGMDDASEDEDYKE